MSESLSWNINIIVREILAKWQHSPEEITQPQKILEGFCQCQFLHQKILRR